MGRTSRWLIVLGIVALVLGAALWGGLVLLPWDQADKLAAGAALGVVIDGGIVLWAAGAIDAAMDERQALPAKLPAALPNQSVGRDGFNIAGAGNQDFRGAHIYYGTAQTPLSPDTTSTASTAITGEGSTGVVPPKE